MSGEGKGKRAARLTVRSVSESQIREAHAVAGKIDGKRAERDGGLVHDLEPVVTFCRCGLGFWGRDETQADEAHGAHVRAEVTLSSVVWLHPDGCACGGCP